MHLSSFLTISYKFLDLSSLRKTSPFPGALEELLLSSAHLAAAEAKPLPAGTTDPVLCSCYHWVKCSLAVAGACTCLYQVTASL